MPTARIVAQPLADGGEGSLDIIRQHYPVQEHRLTVTGPLRRQVQASYLFGEGKAYIEAAQACGLHLVPKPRRNPGYTTTIGVGQLIEDAIARGAYEVNIFLGGSATNDMGAGMAAALGYTFISDKGNDFVPSGDSLRYVKEIIPPIIPIGRGQVTFQAICDVNNPLLGPAGATMTYAQQKGATEQQLPGLESHMRQFAERIQQDLGASPADLPRAGAAGGLGAGAATFLKADLVSGIEWLTETVQLQDLMAEADLIITGEGKLDEQTLKGKVVAGVCALAALNQRPVWAVAGKNELSQIDYPDQLRRVLALMDLPDISEDQAMHNAGALLTRLIRSTFTAAFPR